MSVPFSPTVPQTQSPMSSTVRVESDASFPQLLGALAAVGKVFLGKPEVVRLAWVCLLAEGHLLLEDVPGTGKTLLARTLARCLGGDFHRIQFTPDLLPSDLLGTSVLMQNTGAFEFQAGPIFAHVILADEINRASPRTQSALLEAMSEMKVSLDGKTHLLGPPFFVLATQNPHEFEGTYPLPESQLDRFMMRLTIGYPDRAAERAILEGHRQGDPIDGLQAHLNPQSVVALQKQARQIRFDAALADYLLAIVEATRHHADLRVGASTRAALGFYRAAQANALLAGRGYVIPDDIKILAQPVLSHRLLVRHGQGRDHGQMAQEIVRQIVEKTVVPV
ncbi:MAG: AAA family ATPase [Planctomycetota bacterium]